MPDQEIANAIGLGVNVGAVGLVGWLVRHTFAHTIPRLAGEFRQALDDQRKEFIETIQKMRDEQAAERKDFIAVIDRLRESSSMERRELISRVLGGPTSKT